MILSGEGHLRRILFSMALLMGLSGVAFGQTAPASEIAPGRKLRVGMIAITVLGGVAEPVARFIGQKLGAAVEPVMYPNPEAYLQSFGKGEWDIAIGHVFDCVFGLRELLCIAGAQHYIRVGPVLWIEERIAPDRDPRIGLGDLAELHADVAFARIRAYRFREHANADLELRRHLIEHRLHDRGHARHHDYIADPEARRPRHLVEDAPLGIRVRRSRASFISAPVVFTHSCKMARARGSVSIGTPNAFAAIGGDVTVGRPDPASGEDIGAAPGWTIREISFCGDRAP